ncbi:hypothetical protein GCM10010425_25170 [Streptomyces spororaveus]|uniref:HEAT repeat protein n=1 Tax=Streptomyces spororaveus TaxID=284039 RepID=A0ABQ3TGP1_9ACTN|nr:FUSC family protein [Streptomyces spororaveus]GHI79546.1 hypothetical protein Sspor_51070 [Streptomyces spororaveus]
MSVRDEREPLAPRTISLYDHALSLRGGEPDGRVPRNGRPLPDGSPPEPSRKGLTWEEARFEVTAALTDPLCDPDPVRAAEVLHQRARRLVMPHRTLRAHTARLPLSDEEAARRTARQLTRTGTTVAAVSIGIALLIRLGEPEDVPCLKALGTLSGLGSAASAALDPLDRQAAALLVIRGRDRAGELTPLTEAIATGDAEATRSALLSLPDEDRAMWLARRIAEAADLLGLLRARPRDAELLALTGRLLHRMADPRSSRPEILDYLPARAVYEALVRHADRLPPAPEHRSLLLSVALDLHSGPAVLLNWRPGRRRALLDALDRLFAGAAPGPVPGDRRAGWFPRNRHLPFARTEAGDRPRWEVAVVHASADSSAVETRILADGVPLVPALFGKGPGLPPEYLLDSGALRAGPEPREVQLAQADCTELCCGALYVTIRRDGGEVVWDGWRGAVGPQPPPYRFDAAAYDAEVERAERDLSWCWPARSTARLIAAGLRDRPGLTGRWELAPRWIGTDWRDPDTTVVHLAYTPSAPPPGTGGSLYFEWRLPDDDGPPRDRAAAALRRLETDDPKGFASFRGGDGELAAALGYREPPRTGRAPRT